jgi:hypothetical protein
MARYMSTARFKDLSIMPSPDIDLIESLEAGWVQAQIDRVGAALDARLAKRYAVPFGGAPVIDPPLREDVPQVIEDWITTIVTARAYAKRGVNPSSGELWFTEMVIEPMKAAGAAILEAANSDTGLFDLPLKESAAPAGGATRGGPKGYSEASPYVWTDAQVDAARQEDEWGSGS